MRDLLVLCFAAAMFLCALAAPDVEDVPSIYSIDGDLIVEGLFVVSDYYESTTTTRVP